jgi:hypothetical protein
MIYIYYNYIGYIMIYIYRIYNDIYIYDIMIYIYRIYNDI